MNIHVYIDRLILDGIDIPSGQQVSLQTAVEEELGRLLQNGGLAPEFQSGGDYPTIQGGNIQLPSGDATALGRQIALAVYGGISE